MRKSHLLLLGVLAVPISKVSHAATLIVLNKAEASASLIDLESLKEVARVATGEGPHEACVSPDGKTAVVGNYGVRDRPGSTLTVIDVAKARVVKTIDLGQYRRPHGMQWLRDGRRIVVTAEENQALLVVDVTEGKVLQAIETAQEISHMVVVSPDEKRAWLANIGSGSITAVDLENMERIASVETGKGAEGIDVTPDGKTLWVTNRAEDTISILDAVSLKSIEKIESKSFPIRAKCSPDGRHVLVTNARTGELAVFDAATRREIRRIRMEVPAAETRGRLFGDTFGDSSVPIGILIQPDGARAFVAHANADVISIVDLREWKLAGSVRAGKEPDGMAMSPVAVAVDQAAL